LKSVITTHKNMDLDALGAVIAVKKLFPEAKVVLPDTKSREVVKVLSDYPDILEFTDDSKFKRETLDKLIVVDTNSLQRIPENVRKSVGKNTEIVFYDHHPGKVLEGKAFIKSAGAVTSVLVMMMKGKKITPSPIEASIMLAGIYADTGSFSYSSTSPIDFVASAFLLGCGASVEVAKNYANFELSLKERETLKVLEQNLEVVEVNGNQIGITYARFDEHVPEVAYLVSKLLEKTGLPAVFACIEEGGTTFIIGRSRSPKVDVSEVLKKFGGGGHPEAGSCSLKTKTAIEAKELLMLVLSRSLERLKYAKDIMTSPPIVIPEETSVEEARKILMKHGINCAPVVNGKGFVEGIVSRALIDRAIMMGIEGERVSSICEKDFASVSPEDPVEKVKEIIVSRHQSFVPVVESGKVVGVITRTDLLMNLFREEEFWTRESAEPKYRNVASLLKKNLPEDLYELLVKVGNFADRKKINVYLVGGFVRDLLLGRKNFDIDIVVEGDATEFAKELAKTYGAKVHTYERFKTATVIFPNNLRLDFASARTEIYRSPGALPEVDMAPLKKDLIRRDFTINALAVKINESEFGTLIDFFGGLRDLKDKKIRVLHSLSFVEDPTRILRALRFAVRFRFQLGKNTEKLLKSAVSKNLFKFVEGQRIYHELKQIMLEDNPLRVLNRLSEYGILERIFVGINWNQVKRDLFEKVRKTIIWHKIEFQNAEVGYHLPYFCALFWRENEKKVKNWLNSLAFPEKESLLIKTVLKESPKIISSISKAKDNGSVLEILERKPEELLIFIASLSEGTTREKIIKFMKEWRFLKLPVSGEDLKKFGLKPGPVFGKLLRELTFKVVNGEIDTNDKEAQLEFLEERCKELGLL